MQFTEQQISAVARLLSDRGAEDCGVDKDDKWKIYGEAYINSARHSLNRMAAAAPQVVADERAEVRAFEDFARKACQMPDGIEINWGALWTQQAYEGWKARAALQAAPVQAQEPVLVQAFEESGSDRESGAWFDIAASEAKSYADEGYKVRKLFAAPVQPVAVPDGVPSFYKNDRVEVLNPYGHIYSGVITKAETRWSADKRPYVIYQVRADGEKTSSQVVPSQIMTIAAPAAQGDATQAATDVLAERRRQVEVEGRTDYGDDHQIDCQLARAAATYALCTEPDQLKLQGVEVWPWGRSWWKFTDYRRSLVKSGALILAEIERIDRAAIAAKAAS